MSCRTSATLRSTSRIGTCQGVLRDLLGLGSRQLPDAGQHINFSTYRSAGLRLNIACHGGFKF